MPVFDYDDEGDEMDEENDMAFESLLLAGSQRYSQDQRNDIHTRTSGGPSNRRHDAAFWESVAGLFARLRRGRHSHPHSQHHDHIHHQQHTGRPRGYDAIPPPTVHASPDRYGISEEDDALLLADQEDAVQELTEAQIQEIVEKAAAQQAPL